MPRSRHHNADHIASRDSAPVGRMSAPSAISSNLLIVEDDEGLRRQYRWMFPDLKLSLAGTRQEAIAAVHREAISVAVVDLGLPPSPDDPTEGLATLGAIRNIVV